MILFEMLNRFKKLDKEEVLDELTGAWCSLTLRRRFGESMEDYLDKHPEDRKHKADLEETIEYIKSLDF